MTGVPSEDQSALRSVSRVYAEVDLNAIVRNLELIRERVGEKTKLLNVIKADGYGHGSVPIAQATEDLPYLWGHAVATFEEAMELRRAGIEKPILILGYAFPACYEELVLHDIRPTVFREDSLIALSEAAVRAGRECPVHIAVDTGMSRIGIEPDEIGIAFVKKALGMPGIRVEGMFTHFATADEEDGTRTQAQFGRFTGFLARLEEELSFRPTLCHCANSAAAIAFPQMHLDMVRTGIVGYGLYPSTYLKSCGPELSPAMSLYTRIVYVKEIEAGRQVSYGGTFTAKERMRIATLPVGYADGYPRSLSGKGWVLLHGKRAPILGRVCMDQMMVDVTGIPEASNGDTAVLLGRDGRESITAEDLGELSGRFNYEFCCDISMRVPRFYT